MENATELIGQMTEFLKTEVKTDNIMGQQFQLGDFICVPVMSVGMGLGSGSGKGKGTAKEAGEGEGEGSGGGLGLGMSVVGFLVTKGNDIQFISTKTGKGLSTLFEKAPEMLDKFLNKEQSTTEK